MHKGSRLPGSMIAGLIAVLLIGGIALGGKSSKKPKPAGAAKAPAAQKQKQKQSQPASQLAAFSKAVGGGRAATVVSDRHAHTVVVPPCDTPVQATVADAERGVLTPGATVLQLPRAQTARTVVVPKCSGTSGQTQRPSAALVVATALASASGLKTQMTVDSNAKVRTIVLPPCAPSQSGASQQPAADDTSAPNDRVLVAPPC